MSTAVAGEPEDEFGEDFFTMEADTSKVDEESIHEGGSGNYVSAEGRFHVMIEQVERFSIDREKNKLPQIKISMRVLNGTADSEIQKALSHYLYMAKWVDSKKKSLGAEHLDETAKERLVGFLHAFGVIGEEAFGVSDFKMDWPMFQRLQDTQAIVKVSKQDNYNVKDKDTGELVEKQGGYKISWNTDTWPLGHEKVKDVPLDHEAAAAFGIDAASDEDLEDI